VHEYGRAVEMFIQLHGDLVIRQLRRATRRPDDSSDPTGRVRKTPSARKIARFMTIKRDQVPRDQGSIMAKIAHDVPPLLEARDLVDRFHEMMRQQKVADLDPWIATALDSPLSSFAKGIMADHDAVQAAII
jgi:transposase